MSEPQTSTNATGTCQVCAEPLGSGGYCWSCDDDARRERQEHGAWRTYLREYREKIALIAETAERVCDHRELELIGADLMEWPEQRTADHLGLSVEGPPGLPRGDAHEDPGRHRTGDGRRAIAAAALQVAEEEVVLPYLLDFPDLLLPMDIEVAVVTERHRGVGGALHRRGGDVAEADSCHGRLLNYESARFAGMHIYVPVDSKSASS